MAACQDARLRWADAGADHPRHGLAGADAHAHTQRPVIELRSIQVRPDFVHGRSVRFTRYLFEQQSSPPHVEKRPTHTPPRCVERRFSWINRCRRTVRDYERLPQHHAAMIQWAMIALMTRRLAHHHT
jgi:hypothetical protein